MLSKLTGRAFLRAFSTASNPISRANGLIQIPQTGEVPATQSFINGQQLQEFSTVLDSEKKHLAYYVNEMKAGLNDRISINFEVEQNNKKLVFESVSDGSNYWKLGEVVVLASVANLWKLLLGFPSYVSLVGTLGVAGLGAAWSYSNWLRRSAPQITHIYETTDNKLHIHYLKPSGLISRKESDFVVQSKAFSYISFPSSVENWLRKSNYTQWVNVQGQLFWFSSHPQQLRVNNFSHLF